MKIVCTSDLHGHLPTIEPCDLLLIAGDICPRPHPSGTFPRQWLTNPFGAWVQKTPAAERVLVWGNHDWIAEQTPHLVPPLAAVVLTDQLHEWNGLRTYG